MNGMTSAEAYSGYNSGQGVNYSFEMNIPPTFTVAQASLYYVAGGGLHKTGIVGFRHRPTANGSELSVNYGAWPSWPGSVYVDRMTSVTFGTAVGAEQDFTMVANLFFW